jgi:hypothetical protein
VAWRGMGSRGRGHRTRRLLTILCVLPLSPSPPLSGNANLTLLHRTLSTGINTLSSVPAGSSKSHTSVLPLSVFSPSPSQHRFDLFPPSQVPDPSTIRPLQVLKETLDLLKKKWKQESNYNYICDQFKSMRQDLIVRPFPSPPLFLSPSSLSSPSDR